MGCVREKPCATKERNGQDHQKGCGRSGGPRETSAQEAKVQFGRVARGDDPAEERQLDHKAITVKERKSCTTTWRPWLPERPVPFAAGCRSRAKATNCGCRRD